MPTRRRFLAYGVLLSGAALAVPLRAADGDFPFALSDEEWKERLDEMQYHVLREHGTEYAFSSPLDSFYEPGTYHCAGCGHPLYASDTKYDSRTGWPSFWESLPDAVGTSIDTAFMMVRVECHCANCGGHLGHIFDDGPPPTGKRHCINGVALDFASA